MPQRRTISICVAMLAAVAGFADPGVNAVEQQPAPSRAANPTGAKPIDAKPIGAESPQAAFDQFVGAVRKDDWDTAFRYATPESRRFMVGGTLMVLDAGRLGDEGRALVAKFADIAKLRQALAGLNTKPRKERRGVMEQAAPLVERQPDFMKESLELFHAQRKENVLNDLRKGEVRLESLKVEGNGATAQMSVKFERGGGQEPTKFKLVDERWYFDY